MVLVDSRVGSKELLPYILKIGVKAELATLPYGDFCFEGNGPEGTITVGIERSTIHDMLSKINDARFGAHQKVGMGGHLNGQGGLYSSSFLLIEGCWKPSEDGLLMEGFEGGRRWGFCRPKGQSVMYSKLRRYLFSVAHAGVQVIYTRDIAHTAYDICELYHWYQKRWSDHTALLAVQTVNVPSLSGKPSLVRRWANDLSDIGSKFSMEAENLFKVPLNLALSNEMDWEKIRGIGKKTAAAIIKEIRGIK